MIIKSDNNRSAIAIPMELLFPIQEYIFSLIEENQKGTIQSKAPRSTREGGA
jgi:hypothetical protein